MAEFWTWLNTPPTTDRVLEPFAVAYLIVFAAGFVVSAYVNGPDAASLATNRVQRAGMVHWSNVGLWIFGPGLVFFGVRVLQINPLSIGEPIWLVSSVIAAVIAGARCAQWWRTAYPTLLADDRAETGRDVPQQEAAPLVRHWEGGTTWATASSPLRPASDSRLPAPDS
jgi:hypothetical protein